MYLQQIGQRCNQFNIVVDLELHVVQHQTQSTSVRGTLFAFEQIVDTMVGSSCALL